jgi:Uma2 family endonuclease
MSSTLTPNVPPAVPPAPAARFRDAEELQRAMGGVPLNRILLDPPPGTATVADVIRLSHQENRGVELVDGTLVEKPVGYLESIIAINIATLLNNFIKPRKLGFVSGEQGMIRMLMGNVRMPDVAFVRREDLPGGQVPAEPAPRIPPALAIEVLSASNTELEMRSKVREYFESGVKLVWLIEPVTQTVRVYDAAEHVRELTRDDTLDGGHVLPGFAARVSECFAQ